MCMITTAMTAGGLAALGATTMAASSAAVAATTVATNVVLGAGLSAGIGAAMGQRGSDLGKAALIGGAGAGLLSGVGMAANGVTTATAAGGEVATKTGAGLFSSASSSSSGGLSPLASAAKDGAAAGAPAASQGATQLVEVTPEMAAETGAEVGTKVAVPAEGAAPATQPAAADAAKGGTEWGKMALLAGAPLAAGGAQAYGAYQEGKDAAAALRAQGKADAAARGVQAKSIIDSANVEAKDLARRQRLARGKGIVAAAANGVMLESRAESSPAMWEQDMAAEAAWDREKLFHNANMRARAALSGGSMYGYQARQARSGGALKAATSLIRGGIGAGMQLWGNPSVSLYA